MSFDRVLQLLLEKWLLEPEILRILRKFDLKVTDLAQ